MRWKQISSPSELRGLTAGQGSDWPDFAILRANGFKVYGTTNYDSLFSMLETERIDYFPRSVNEVWMEADAHQEQLMVEPTLAFRYAAASYYFVRKGNEQLASDITVGLEKMIADGSFDKLFQEYYGEIIRRSTLKERRIIELDNPLLPNGIPVERRKLLFRE
jgi:ABC-type amino acid transport substrate-binding protein